jgi:hypothetical protein
LPTILSAFKSTFKSALDTTIRTAFYHTK